MTNKCQEEIVQNEIIFKCDKDANHGDMFWHKSKVVRVTQPINDKKHKYIMITATWRTELIPFRKAKKKLNN